MFHACGTAVRRWATARFRLAALVCGLGLVAPGPGARSDTGPEERPSILLILSDDQGYGDVSCFGGDIPTPGIDRLAREGARLTQFYAAAPVCTPSRFALLTGKHPLRAQGGLDRVGMMLDASHRAHGLRAGERTLGEVLRSAGYGTALVGKWHLGHGSVEAFPTRHGFEHFYGMAGGCVDYATHRYGDVPDWYRGEEPVEEEGYATDLLTAEAIRFLRAQDGDAPFLLVLAYNAPHYGKSLASDAGPETLATAAFGKPRTDPETGREVQLVNSLQAPRAWLERFAHVEDPKRRAYAAMVAAMDDGIARVLATLDECGLAESTLVFFAADHGADGSASSAGSNAPLRGSKATLWEGGVRVPALVRWPGRVEAGSEVDQVSSLLDLVPTLARAARADVAGVVLDGIDLREAWAGGAPRQRELFWRHAGVSAYRRGPWKLVGDGLFRLDRDPGETRDLAAEHPEVALELEAARRARRELLAGTR